ncbi:MAG: uracil-DNA glycosylase [Acidobacteriota bacterium]
MGDKDLSGQLRLRAAYLAGEGLGYALARSGPKAPGSDGPPSTPLEQIRIGMGDCRLCRLCEKRTRIVFGAGSPRARLLFVGEGPGAEEDEKGIPFVGRAGQLLTEIITRGMGLRREEVYIANVVKCRPPENRTPQPDEMAACMPFLEAQIACIRPEVIVTLGATAAQGLLGEKVAITRFRGQWRNYKGIPLMPTYHPSYLLRNPAAKGDVWTDIQQVMARLGLSRPEKKS